MQSLRTKSVEFRSTESFASILCHNLPEMLFQDLTYCLTYGVIVFLFLIVVIKDLNISDLPVKYNQRVSTMWRLLVTLSALLSVCRCQSSARLNLLTDSLLQQFMTRLDNNQNIDDISYISRVSRITRRR